LIFDIGIYLILEFIYMKHLHFIGIEGSGASAVAALAKEHGYRVSGCDRNLTGEYSSLFSPEEYKGGEV
jgi:UDP-N-acetylmuramate-alanine ligase